MNSFQHQEQNNSTKEIHKIFHFIRPQYQFGLESLVSWSVQVDTGHNEVCLDNHLTLVTAIVHMLKAKAESRYCACLYYYFHVTYHGITNEN